MTTAETNTAPGELTVTAHATLAEPLITVEGPDVVLTPREATSFSEQLAAACAEIYRHRPDIAQRDRLERHKRAFVSQYQRRRLMRNSSHPEERRLWRTQVVVEAIDHTHTRISLPAWQGSSSIRVPLRMLPERWRRAGVRGYAYANLGCTRVAELRIDQWDDHPQSELKAEAAVGPAPAQPE